MINAIKKAGKKEGESSIIIVSGADPQGRRRSRGHETGSLAFFPERTASGLLAILEDVLAGKPVPMEVNHPTPVDHARQHRQVLPGRQLSEGHRRYADSEGPRPGSEAPMDGEASGPRIAASWPGLKEARSEPRGVPRSGSAGHVASSAIYLWASPRSLPAHQNLLNITEAVAVVGIAAAFATVVVIGGGHRPDARGRHHR